MPRFVPSRFSAGWLALGAVFAVLLSAAFVLHLYLLQTWSPVVAWRRALFAVGLSALLHAAGWFGLRWLYLCGVLGAVIGVAMLYVYTASDAVGWEDLIGVLTMMFAMAIGLAAGAAAEIAAALWKWLKKHRP